jgi:hypothetical protein
MSQLYQILRHPKNAGSGISQWKAHRALHMHCLLGGSMHHLARHTPSWYQLRAATPPAPLLSACLSYTSLRPT